MVSHVFLTSAGETEYILHLGWVIPGDFTVSSAWMGQAEPQCPPARHRQSPTEEWVSKNWFVARGALAPACKKLQGEELFSLRKQASLPGSRDFLPGRIRHPTLLGFTIQTSSSSQKEAHEGSEALTPVQAYPTAQSAPWESLSISAQGPNFLYYVFGQTSPGIQVSPWRWHTDSWPSLSDKKWFTLRGGIGKPLGQDYS